MCTKCAVVQRRRHAERDADGASCREDDRTVLPGTHMCVETKKMRVPPGKPTPPAVHPSALYGRWNVSKRRGEELLSGVPA